MTPSISIEVSRLEAFLLAVCVTVIIDSCASQRSYADNSSHIPSIRTESIDSSYTSIFYQQEGHPFAKL